MLKEPSPTAFIFDNDPLKRRWVFTNKAENLNIVANKQVQVETKVMEQMDNVKQTRKLVEILDMLPTLNIKLSKL